LFSDVSRRTIFHDARRQQGFLHRTLFTGHLNQQGWREWQAGEVDFCRWNVHPTLSCLKILVEALACDYFAPLFTSLDDVAQWRKLLDCQIVTQRQIEI